ncbi:MAG: FAD/NAD(P)-binding oxidoreductase, partial [Clostridium sp.]|nr:FAD/NAD(P)-binding oxidoreductase [Clostridium sp.]
MSRGCCRCNNCGGCCNNVCGGRRVNPGWNCGGCGGFGGGFGGASCARALRQADAKLEVTLVEANKTFTSCPQSNEVIAGLREISAQYFGYDKIAAEGVRVVLLAAAAIDAPAHKVTLVDGATLAYDRLVLAPGIDIDFTALQGYDEAASALMPHAYKAGEQ